MPSNFHRRSESPSARSAVPDSSTTNHDPSTNDGTTELITAGHERNHGSAARASVNCCNAVSMLPNGMVVKGSGSPCVTPIRARNAAGDRALRPLVVRDSGMIFAVMAGFALVLAAGVPPAWLPALLALAGDGDEAPGLDGIGEKRAAELLRRHGRDEDAGRRPGIEVTPEALLDTALARWQWESTAKGKPSKVGLALRDGADVARMSLRLVELREMQVSLDLAEMRVGWSDADAERVRAIGEETNIAVLRGCPARPKSSPPDELVRRERETRGS